MANIIQSALQQAMGAMDKYVRDPIVNTGVRAVRGAQGIGNRIQSAQDQAYQNYWKNKPHELLSPLGVSEDQRMMNQGWQKIDNGAWQKVNPQTGATTTFGAQGKTIPMKNPVRIGTPGINGNAPAINVVDAPVGAQDIANGFKFIMGQKQYPQAKGQIQAMYKARGNPPMAQYVDQFVVAGEKYGVDPRILAAISQIESSGGKHYPVNTYNPFGYLGGQGATVNEKLNAGFTSIPHAIDALTRRFATRYPDFIKNPTPSQLQQSYNATPSERQRYLDIMSQIIPDMQ